MENNKFTKYIIIALIFFVGIIILYAIFFINEFGINIKADHNNWGQFGSYMGGVLGPIFAFITLIAILHTIDLQSTDINIRVNETKVQKQLAEDQKNLLDLQKFESTYFNLLNQITNIINNYTCNSQEGASFFRDALVQLWRNFKEDIYNPQAIDDYFEKNEPQCHVEFKNFVLHIANIIKIINNSSLDIREKYIYYEVLNGFLSNRQKYFIEVCYNSFKYFQEEKEFLYMIHRTEKRWIKTEISEAINV